MNTRALVLDIWSELNRGDGAMQFTIMDNLRRHNHDITAVADYGASDLAEFADEFDESEQIPFEIVPSLKFTNYNYMTGVKGKWSRRILMLSKHLLNIVLFYYFMIQIRTGLVFDPRLKRFIQVVDGSNTIIWNGRNFRSNKKSLEYFEVFDLLFMFRLTHQILQKRGRHDLIPFVGISVWPFKSQKARNLFLQHVSKVKIFARETETWNYLTQIDDGLNLERIQDLSFYCLRQLCQDDVIDLTPAQDSGPKVIGIVLKEWTVDGQAARQAYLKKIVEFLQDFDVAELAIIEQVPMKKESTDQITEDFVAEIRSHGWTVKQYRERNSIQELLNIYRSIDLLVTSRMHAAIFALGVGTPPICIAYDRGAKWQILKDLGISASNSFKELSVDKMREDYNINKNATPIAQQQIMKAGVEIENLDVWK